MKIKFLFKTILISSLFFKIFLPHVQKVQSCFSISPFCKKDIKKSKDKSFEFKTFVDWKNACTKLRTEDKVTHGKLKGLVKNATFKDACLSKKELKKAIKKFICVTKKSSFLQPQNWIGGEVPKDSFLAIDEKHQHCMFFVKKIIVSPEAKIFMHADLHGDIHSFMKYLNYLFLENKIDKNFAVTDKNSYHIFLGDYTDGWLYGSEVLYTILRFKIANPENVILLRGNHEDLVQNKMHGFKKEFFKKFAYKKNKKLKKFGRLGVVYNLLPSAVYLGVPSVDKRFTNYLLFFHGGLEPRFNPHCLLAKKGDCLYQWLYKHDTSWFKGFKSRIYDKTFKYSSCAKRIGFMWNDFIVDESQRKKIIKSHRRYPGLYKFSKGMTEKFLHACSCENKYKVRAIFRGHQHSHKPMYKKLFENHGIYNLWSNNQWDGKSDISLEEGSVWTLQACPRALKNIFFKKWPFNFDIHVVLQLDKRFKNWVIQPKKLECM